MMTFFQRISMLTLLLATFALPSCSTEGSALDSPATYFFAQNKTALQALGADGVSVMRLGDSVTIIIPSKTLFKGYSVQISDSGKNILEQVTKLLEPMNKVKITVASYAEAMAQSKKDLMMTQWQAQTVSNYFWDNHVNARMIYAIGYGGGHPIQYEQNKVINDIVGDYDNYRVEITLKDYVQ